MQTYLVIWEIDGESAYQAATVAWRVMHDPDSIATMFTVRSQGEPDRTIDVGLREDDRP